jgi:hypothetical protein
MFLALYDTITNEIMFNVPIFNADGNQVNQLSINDDLQYVGGRVYRGNQHYYKGVGVPYIAHSLLHPDTTGQYEMIRKSGVFYLGYKVKKKAFVGKTGIFQERYQPFFPDFIGACSIKEGTIVINSISFERSSVDVLDCIQFDEVNQQHYYILDYRCERKHYLTDNGDPQQLIELLRYMISSQWNFLWDKGSINDITHDGRVSDVADLFKSDHIDHQLGTVYSVLYSMGRADQYKYQEFLQACNLNHVDDSSFVYNAVELLKANGVDVGPLIKYNAWDDNYKHIVMNHLLTGKNCAYCACDLFKHQGDAVRDQYLQLIQL